MIKKNPKLTMAESLENFFYFLKLGFHHAPGGSWMENLSGCWWEDKNCCCLQQLAFHYLFWGVGAGHGNETHLTIRWQKDRLFVKHACCCFDFMRKFPLPPCAIHDRLRRKPLSIEILSLPTIIMHLLYHVVVRFWLFVVSSRDHSTAAVDPSFCYF